MSLGIVNWKIASRPPIKMPFRKVENCNQVVIIGKQLKFSLVNVAGKDIVQGNRKLILGMLFNILFFLRIKYQFDYLKKKDVDLALQLICGN